MAFLVRARPALREAPPPPIAAIACGSARCDAPRPMRSAWHVSRRSVLTGCVAGLAELLLTRRLAAASVRNPLSGAPGELDLSLTALSPGTLRISIAPFDAWPPEEELGVLAQPEASSDIAGISRCGWAIRVVRGRWREFPVSAG